MNTAIVTLKERGFLSQCTNTEGLSAAMDSGQVTFYIGVDPTAPSLHIGHMVPFFALSHLVHAGHKGICLIGAGTARIGDPSGKTETRKILSYETLDENAALVSRQLNYFLANTAAADAAVVAKTAAAASKKSGEHIFANNKDWLANLNYIDFLREIGSHFSVNRMLSFEAYKQRLEQGLSFLEFNYQLLQSYDYLELFRRYGNTLQIGGDDQWGNIVAGVDLIRRIEGKEVFGMTFPLVTTSDGKKMGKTEKGALFLDPAMTSTYDFFQYWRNVPDADTKRFLLMFTFLPAEECEKLCTAEKNPNEAKERLAWEITALIHGKDEADKALAGAKAAFGGGGNRDAIPTVSLSRSKFETGYNIVDLFTDAGLAATKSEARRLVEQGGAFVGNESISDVKAIIGADALDAAGELVLRAGKKRYCRVVIG
ncbi:MAG: tyrosine--tRNA ligase [Treponema sp.]|nr:tyrosine--tRNA ligase [Treponema sp.]